MKPKMICKIAIDFIMTVLLLLLMARQITGDSAHEWLGMGMFVLLAYLGTKGLQKLNARKKENKVLNAYVKVTEEQALATAKKVDEKIMRGESLLPLEGIPMSLKDNISCGHPLPPVFEQAGDIF